VRSAARLVCAHSPSAQSFIEWIRHADSKVQIYRPLKC
jgi:hypothetical protein